MAKKNDIKYQESWTFKNKNIAENFDTHVRQSVPLYDEVQRMVAEISNFYLRSGDCMVDLGCSTGTTIMKIRESCKKPISCYGIDESQQMIDIANSRTKAQFICSKLESYDFTMKEPISVVTLLYSLQFLNFENRLQIIQKSARALRRFGCLILVEKVRPDHAFFNEMMLELYHDMKISNGLSPIDNVKKTRSLRGVMNPISLDENRVMLLQAGFSKIDIFFKWYNFIGFIAEK